MPTSTRIEMLDENGDVRLSAGEFLEAGRSAVLRSDKRGGGRRGQGRVRPSLTGP